MLSKFISDHRKEVRRRLLDEIGICNEDHPDAVAYAILTVMTYCERYNLYELEDKVKEQAAEIARLTDLVGRESWAPLDMVAGGPGAPGYDDESYTEPMDNFPEGVQPDPIFGKQNEIPPVIEEWRLPEKDR